MTLIRSRLHQSPRRSYTVDTSRHLSPRPLTHRTSNRRSSDSKPDPIIKACRDALVRTAQESSPASFQVVLIAMSCRAACLQLMHVDELCGAVAAYVATRYQMKATVGPMQIMSPGYLMDLCQHLLLKDVNGYTHFKIPAMRYLTKIFIPILLDGHVVLAQACLARITSLDPRIIWASSTYCWDQCNTESKFGHQMDRFSAYAVNYWEDHCRLAQDEDPSVFEHFHLCVERAVRVSIPQESPVDTQQFSETTLRTGLDIAQKHNLCIISKIFADKLSQHLAPRASKCQFEVHDVSNRVLIPTDEITNSFQELELDHDDGRRNPENYVLRYGRDSTESSSDVEQSWTLVSYSPSEADSNEAFSS